MTEAELRAIIDGLAPVVRSYVQTAVQTATTELGTLRTRVAVLEAERAALHAQTETVDVAVNRLSLELEASDDTVN